MTEIFNKKSETPKRKELRHNMPKAEVVIWTHLKGKQMQGHKFRRQYSVGSYVLDFYCPKLKLAIEIDGDSHFQNGAEEYDGDRQALIEQLGIRFLRFTNLDVYKNLKGVLEAIFGAVQACKSTSPLSPPFHGGDKKMGKTPCSAKGGAVPLRKGDTNYPLLTKEGIKGRLKKSK